MNRPDDVLKMLEFEGKHHDQSALLVLGGSSGIIWKDVKKDVSPHSLLGVNGVNTVIESLDYWLFTENMTRAYFEVIDDESKKYDPIFSAWYASANKMCSATRFINYKTVKCLDDSKDIIRIKRHHYELDVIDFKQYGEGLLTGPIYDEESIISRVRLGTVALQLLHLSTLLGFTQLHTIGLDLCFREKDHWYEYPRYRQNYFFRDSSYIEFKGLKTLDWWVKTAYYLKEVQAQLAESGIKWIDHSDGLLQVID